jgi:putative membrane protein
VIDADRRSWLRGLAAAVGCSLPALAHAHAAPPAPTLTSWTATPWLWLGLAACIGLYARGHFVLRARLGAPLRRGGLRALYFALAIATLFLALLSPLDAWSDQSFAAHMVQHELLMLVAAPLLVLARPLEPYFWALPQAARARTLALVRSRPCAWLFHALTAPGVALLVHGATRWLWHIPALFEACLHDELLHGIQHASFFLTALMFWWALLQGMHGRAGYGVAVVFVFATALHTGGLGALIAFAHHPWYPDQTLAAGMNPLADQQLAGLIMWIVAGTWLTGLGLALFVVWLGMRPTELTQRDKLQRARV